MHRHSYSGGVIASVASLDLVTIQSILVPPSARYHILKMFTSSVLRITNGKQISIPIWVLAGPWITIFSIDRKLDLHQEVGGLAMVG